jgi:hypothetical protein
MLIPSLSSLEIHSSGAPYYEEAQKKNHKKATNQSSLLAFRILCALRG